MRILNGAHLPFIFRIMKEDVVGSRSNVSNKEAYSSARSILDTLEILARKEKMDNCDGFALPRSARERNFCVLRDSGVRAMSDCASFFYFRTSIMLLALNFSSPPLSLSLSLIDNVAEPISGKRSLDWTQLPRKRS